MDITEKELQDALMERECFYEDDTKFSVDINFIEREFKIGNERIDILGVDSNKNVYVIELKKGNVDGNALTQVLSYASQVKFLMRESKDISVRCILVGNSIDERVNKTLIGNDEVAFVKYSPSIEIESHDKIFVKEFFDGLSEAKNTILENVNGYFFQEE